MGSAAAQLSPYLIQQYVDSLFSRLGGGIRPYDKDLEYEIRRQILGVLPEYPGLQVSLSQFIHDDGRSVTLLQLNGTVPMYYKGTKYNIPVVMWLMEPFPRTAPLVYVTPTKDMIVKPRHSHVDPSGMVHVPYLQDWVFPRSTLLDLTQILTVIFGQEPPLYSKPQPPSPSASSHSPVATPTYSPQFPPPQANHRGSSSVQGQNVSFLEGNQNSSYTPFYYPQSPGGGGAAAAAAALSREREAERRKEEERRIQEEMSRLQEERRTQEEEQRKQEEERRKQEEETRRRHGEEEMRRQEERKRQEMERERQELVMALTERLQAELSMKGDRATKETDELLSVQRLLEQRGQAAEAGMQDLRREREALEQALQILEVRSKLLEAWVGSNKARAPPPEDPETAFQSDDIWSKQLLDCLSQDLAIEDVIYSLDRAAHSQGLDNRNEKAGLLSVDTYLKHTRMLAREQFFHRALALKVKAAQMHAQVMSMGGGRASS